MKIRIIILFVFLNALIISCSNKKDVVITNAQRQAHLDSIILDQQNEIREMELQSLRDRLSIEVKEKTDSILAERHKNHVQKVAPITMLPKPQDSIKNDMDTGKITN